MYNTYYNCMYQPWRNCLPSTNGSNTTSYYNTTAGAGIFSNTTNGTYYATYICSNLLTVAPNKANILEAFFLTFFTAAASLFYSSSWKISFKILEIFAVFFLLSMFFSYLKILYFNFTSLFFYIFTLYFIFNQWFFSKN